MNITMLQTPVISGGDAETGDEILLPYAGGEVAVQVVDTVGGWYKPGYASADAICRSEAGEYFLAREIYLDPLGEGEPEFHLPGEGRWLRVKQISFKTAMLYVCRCTASVFKQDVLEILAVPEVGTSHVHRYADGSMDVAVHFRPAPARFLLAACGYNGRGPVAEVYESVDVCVRGLLARGWDDDRRMEAAFDDNAPGEDDEPHPEAVTVADLTRSKKALLRELFSLQRCYNEVAGKTFGVSPATLEGAAAYAAKNGRTLDEFIAEALEMAAESAPAGETTAPAAELSKEVEAAA